MEFFLHDDEFLGRDPCFDEEAVNFLSEDRPGVDVGDDLCLPSREKPVEHLRGHRTDSSSHFKKLSVSRNL